MPDARFRQRPSLPCGSPKLECPRFLAYPPHSVIPVLDYEATAVVWSPGVLRMRSFTSSGKIGCPAEEIVITDDHPRWGARTWTATCRDQRYLCSATATGNNTEQISCAPELRVTAPPPAQTSACNPPCSPSYDCQKALCIPPCNPKCGAGMVCGQNRSCEPTPSPPGTSE